MYTYCFNNPVNMTDANGNWPNWDKLVKGALLVTIGALAVAAVVSTGGACAPLVALGYSALGTAGAALTIIGSSEVGESITGANPIKESIGEDTYDTIRDASLAVVSMGGTLLDAGANAVCFVAGTEIRTDTGEVAIEDVAAGAIVWAMNPDTGEVALKKVVRTFVNETDELIHVKVSGEEIICTPSHPFYSPVKGWTKAVDLRAGDILVRLNGTYIIVEQVQHELLETPVRVYNFEVADFHTYFVGKEPVLVHNKCGDDFSTKYTKNYSANFSNEREARNFARTKVGHNPIQVADGKIRSANNVWQYRAKSGDIAKRHVHIEKLNPKTGEVLLNWHLRW